MVGNGQHLDCSYLCKAVTIDIQATLFTMDLHVLPIVSADIVLGVQWLQSLGPVLTDYNTLRMQFFHDGQLIELRGNHVTNSALLTSPQFRRLCCKQS